MTETVISSEEIYKGRIVHLHVDTVRLENGNEAKREIVSHGGAVCIVPVMEDGTVLLVKQFRLATGKALLEIPAGTLEKDEDPDACALRELEKKPATKPPTCARSLPRTWLPATRQNLFTLTWQPA